MKCDVRLAPYTITLIETSISIKVYKVTKTTLKDEVTLTLTKHSAQKQPQHKVGGPGYIRWFKDD